MSFSFLCKPWFDSLIIQYDTPPEISPPREIERGRRWSAEPSPSRRSRSRSHSSYQPAVRRRENNSRHSPTPRHGRDSSAEARRDDRPNHGNSPNRSPRGREDHNSRNRSSPRRHSPPDGVQAILRNERSDGVSYPEASSSAIQAEMQNYDFPVRPPPGDGENGNGQLTEIAEEIAATTDITQLSDPQGDDSAALLAANEAGVTRLINGPLEGTGDKVADYVDDVGGGSSANPRSSRKRSAGWNVHVHRNRTLSESIQAYLSRPTAPWHPPKKHHPVSRDERPTGTLDAGRTDTRPRLLLRLTDGPPLGKLPSARKTTVERTADGDPSPPVNDAASAQPPHDRRFQPRLFSSNDACAIGTERANGGDRADEMTSGAGDGRSGVGFSPGAVVTPLARKAIAALLRASVVEGSLVDVPASVRTSGADDVPEDVRGGRTSADTTVSASLDDEAEDDVHGRTDMDTTGLSICTGDKRALRVDLRRAVGDDASGDVAAVLVSKSGFGGSGSVTTSRREAADTGAGGDGDALALEKRLQARARVRVRLEALKGSESGSGRQGSRVG